MKRIAMLSKSLLGCCLGCCLLLGGCDGGSSSSSTQKPAEPEKSETAKSETQASGDPKDVPIAIPAETDFNFGVLELGQPGTHEFVFENKGTAPLTLKSGKTTCKCTVGNTSDEPIPPGGVGKVTLTWTPGEGQSAVRQMAEILTNDPKKPSIQLTIRGQLQERIKSVPGNVWPVNDILEAKTGSMTAYVISSVVDQFEIKEIKNDNPHVKIESEKMTDEELTEQKAKVGYKLQVTVTSDVPVGAFRFPIKLQTDVPSRTEKGDLGEPLQLAVEVVGKRLGPISIFGPMFKEEFMIVNLGNFDALKGKKVTLSMFVQNAPAEGFKFESVETDPKELKVTLEPDPRAVGKAKRFLLTFEYPPNSPRVNRWQNDSEAAVVKVKTNHKSAPEMRFGVLLNAF